MMYAGEAWGQTPLTIENLTPTITKTYDGNTTIIPSNITFTVSGIVSGDDVTVSVSSANFQGKSVGTGKEVRIG